MQTKRLIVVNFVQVLLVQFFSSVHHMLVSVMSVYSADQPAVLVAYHSVVLLYNVV